MHFSSPEELAAHLATTIDDEAFIMKAVRIKFPDWNGGNARSQFMPHPPRRLSSEEARKSTLSNKRAYAGRNYIRPERADNDWFASEHADKVFHKMLDHGSRALLIGIHREHPSIMEALKAQGRQVIDL